MANSSEKGKSPKDTPDVRRQFLAQQPSRGLRGEGAGEWSSKRRHCSVFVGRGPHGLLRRSPRRMDPLSLLVSVEFRGRGDPRKLAGPRRQHFQFRDKGVHGKLWTGLAAP